MGEERKNGTTMRGENMSKRMVRGEIREGSLTRGKGEQGNIRRGGNKWRIVEIKLVT